MRAISIWEAFLRKCDDMQVARSRLEHAVLREDYRALLDSPLVAQADLFYLDPPYSDAQYSRFYHVSRHWCATTTRRCATRAATAPTAHQSRFCQRANAEGEFDWAIGRTAALGKPLVISYSSRGLVPQDRLEALCRLHYRDVEVTQASHNHSSQGKGPAPVRELVFACR